MWNDNKPLEYPKDPTLIDPRKNLLEIKIWGIDWKRKFWQNIWMGNMAMGECKNWQRKSCIAQRNCKHIEGGYGRLPLGKHTCREILSRMRKF
jgi:hypothetical protein